MGDSTTNWSDGKRIISESDNDEEITTPKSFRRASFPSSKTKESQQPQYRRHTPSPRNWNSTPKRLHHRQIDKTTNKTRHLSFEEHTVPKYKDHQLLGDSQFVRFAEQMLSMSGYVSRTDDTNSRCIGYCVSGQKIEDLKCRLTENNYKVHPNVIMMIGTNDVVQKTNIPTMCRFYDEILNNLKTKCVNIVLLTVPPVAKLEYSELHWHRLEYFNKFIEKKADDKQIFVVDLGSIFITYNNTIVQEYFEKTFYPGDKPDLVHLNRKGFKIMMAVLDIRYFQQRPSTSKHSFE